jgi:hypothetical protein
MRAVQKVPQAKLNPSEVVTIGILFALIGGHFRAFYRWLKRDYDKLFGGLPDRTSMLRQLQAQQYPADQLLAEPSVLKVIDSFPLEWLFPIREGRSSRQLGKKNKDKGRWSIGLKLCWILNTVGQVVGWHWLTMNRSDQDFLPLVDLLQQEAVVLSDLGFRCKNGTPDNLKLCTQGTWNERMVIETVFSLLTVVCHAQKMFHRVERHIQARLAYTAAMFNVLVSLFHQLHPDENALKISIAEFSL